MRCPSFVGNQAFNKPSRPPVVLERIAVGSPAVFRCRFKPFFCLQPDPPLFILATLCKYLGIDRFLNNEHHA